MNAFFKRVKQVYELANELYANYRARLAAVATLGFASGLFEGISISLLVPLFTVFLKGGEFGSNFALNAISSTLSFLNLELSFKLLFFVTLFMFFLKTVAVFFSGFIRARVIAKYKRDTRVRLYSAFLGADFSYLRKQKTGYLSHVITGEVKQCAKLFDDLVGLILLIGSSLMYLTVAFALSVPITILSIIIGTALLFAFLPFVRKISRYSNKVISFNKSISHVLSETIVGIKTVKAMGVENDVVSSANTLFGLIEQMEFRKKCMKLVAKLSFEPVSVVFILFVFAVSYFYLPFNIVSFIAIVYLINRLFGNISNIQSGLILILEEAKSAESVVSVYKEAVMNTSQNVGVRQFALKKELSVNNISFDYGKSVHVLSSINFRVDKGESVGIIGPSGAGKTTLVDLLLGLLAPTSGNIAIDGINMQEISADNWRKKVIYVAQEVFLRNDTIAENIRFYDSSISDEDIITACKQANIYDFIQTLPKGLKTIVGERGTRLSGGERQRIAIARALARKPEILILDEATSALDAESEREIKETLAGLHNKITIIIIAHRLTTVADADRIIALENGRVVEEGAPSELQKNPNSYYSRALRASIS